MTKKNGQKEEELHSSRTTVQFSKEGCKLYEELREQYSGTNTHKKGNKRKQQRINICLVQQLLLHNTRFTCDI